MGTGCQEIQPWDQRLVPHPALQGRERDWRLNQLPMVNDLVNYVSAMKPYKSPKRLNMIGQGHLSSVSVETSFSLVAQMVKSLVAAQETQVQSLGQEHSLEKEMATCSSSLAWKIPLAEEPSRIQTMGLQRVRHNWATSLSFSSFFLQRLNPVLLQLLTFKLPWISSGWRGRHSVLQNSW